MIDREYYRGKTTYTSEDMIRVIRDLRDPDEGCPWDRVQTHESMTHNLIEECYEAVNAIRLHDPENLKEELGDILLQLVFHSQLAEEKGQFTWDDVIQELCEKLVRRHPHVFADTSAASPEAALKSWNDTKAAEEKKGQEAGKNDLERIPPSLPALMRAQKVLRKASEKGYDPHALDVDESDLRNEMDKMLDAMKEGDIPDESEEAGSFLFLLLAYLRKKGVNAEKSLTLTTEKYITRISR